MSIRINEKGKGIIINTASTGGFSGAHAGVAYGASKHAVIGLTKNTGFMYAKKGIRCNAIAPDAVETNIGLSMKNINQFGMERAGLTHGLSPRSLIVTIPNIYFPRGGTSTPVSSLE